MIIVWIVGGRGGFLLDKSGAGGLDDWEVKIADFVVLLGKDAKKVFDTTNRTKCLRQRWLWCRKRFLTPLIHHAFYSPPFSSLAGTFSSPQLPSDPSMLSGESPCSMPLEDFVCNCDMSISKE